MISKFCLQLKNILLPTQAKKNLPTAKFSEKPYSQSAETVGALREKRNYTQVELCN
jgi:hypothetical protein